MLLLRYASNLTYGSAVGAGMLLGLLVMGRSNALLLLLLLLGWTYLTARGLPKHRVALVLAFSLTFFLVLLPFFLRNYQVQGAPIPFQGGFSFYLSTNPEADGTPYVRQGAHFQRLELMPLQRGFNTPAEKGAFYTAESLRFMYRDPLAYLQLLYHKFRLFWNAFEIPVSADLRYYETHFPLYRLFLFSLNQRRLEQARHALEQSLKHDPRPANAHPAYHNLGYVFFFQKDFQQARQTFERALHNRETAQTYYSLSHVFANLNLADEQIHALEQAVRLKPDFVPAHRNLGVLYMRRAPTRQRKDPYSRPSNTTPNRSQPIAI